MWCLVAEPVSEHFGRVRTLSKTAARWRRLPQSSANIRSRTADFWSANDCPSFVARRPSIGGFVLLTWPSVHWGGVESVWRVFFSCTFARSCVPLCVCVCVCVLKSFQSGRLMVADSLVLQLVCCNRIGLIKNEHVKRGPMVMRWWAFFLRPSRGQRFMFCRVVTRSCLFYWCRTGLLRIDHTVHPYQLFQV